MLTLSAPPGEKSIETEAGTRGCGCGETNPDESFHAEFYATKGSDVRAQKGQGSRMPPPDR